MFSNLDGIKYRPKRRTKSKSKSRKRVVKRSKSRKRVVKRSKSRKRVVKRSKTRRRNNKSKSRKRGSDGGNREEDLFNSYMNTNPSSSPVRMKKYYYYGGIEIYGLLMNKHQILEYVFIPDNIILKEAPGDDALVFDTEVPSALRKVSERTTNILRTDGIYYGYSDISYDGNFTAKDLIKEIFNIADVFRKYYLPDHIALNIELENEELKIKRLEKDIREINDEAYIGRVEKLELEGKEQEIKEARSNIEKLKRKIEPENEKLKIERLEREMLELNLLLLNFEKNPFYTLENLKSEKEEKEQEIEKARSNLIKLEREIELENEELKIKGLEREKRIINYALLNWVENPYNTVESLQSEIKKIEEDIKKARSNIERLK